MGPVEVGIGQGQPSLLPEGTKASPLAKNKQDLRALGRLPAFQGPSPALPTRQPWTPAAWSRLPDQPCAFLASAALTDEHPFLV